MELHSFVHEFWTSVLIVMLNISFIFRIYLRRPCIRRPIHISYKSLLFFFFNKTFNIRLISVSSAESTFCVGTDVKRFSCVSMRVTDFLSFALRRANCALDRLFAAREILNISGSGQSPCGSSRGFNASFAKEGGGRRDMICQR